MRLTLLARFALATLVLFAVAQFASAIANDTYIQWTDSPGAFPLVNSDNVAAVHVDPSDWAGVVRAVGDLRDDIKRVTGKEPADRRRSPHPIIVGTLGHCPLIDRLIDDGKIDVSAIQGKWESFLIQVVPHALPDA